MDTIKENLIFKIKNTQSFITKHQEYEERERAFFNLSSFHRMLGIAYLLGDADRHNFFQNLILSGQARKKSLSLFRQTIQKPGRFQCTSNIAPFLDAIVAGDETLANDIISLSVDHWLEEEEYEEDYCYASFLFSLIPYSNKAIPKQEKKLEKYKNSLQGNQSIRLALCQAIVERDQASFDSEFIDLLEEWELQYHEEEASLPMKSERHRTEKYIFIEAIAILKVAEKVGLKTDKEYKFCPGLARI